MLTRDRNMSTHIPLTNSFLLGRDTALCADVAEPELAPLGHTARRHSLVSLHNCNRDGNAGARCDFTEKYDEEATSGLPPRTVISTRDGV